MTRVRVAVTACVLLLVASVMFNWDPFGAFTGRPRDDDERVIRVTTASLLATTEVAVLIRSTGSGHVYYERKMAPVDPGWSHQTVVGKRDSVYVWVDVWATKRDTEGWAECKIFENGTPRQRKWSDDDRSRQVGWHVSRATCSKILPPR